MSISRVAPTLAPPSAAALARGLLALVAPPPAPGALERRLAELFPEALAVVGASSGRAALAAALEVAVRRTGRRRVVVPAWTSFSVAAAAAAAGARVDLCDVDPHTLGLDRKALRDLVGEDTAAVVLGNAYGIPDATGDLEWLGRAGVLVVDDAAQALGAMERGRAAGARGALGVLSFGRGKCVTLGEGGALLFNDAELAREAGSIALGPALRGARSWGLAAAAALCRSRLCFGLLSRLPGVKVGESWYEPRFERRRPSAAARGLASDLAAAVARQLEARRRVAGWWREALAPLSELWVPVAPPGTDPAWLRFPALAPHRPAREAIVSRLARERFTFVRSYPHALSRLTPFVREVAAARATPGADSVADRLLALPCHEAVTREDVAGAARAVREALSEAALAAPPLLVVQSTRGD